MTSHGTLPPDGAALVRPDGYIAWRAVAAPAEAARAFTAALAEVASAAAPALEGHGQRR